jgi:hypothetical protein
MIFFKKNISMIPHRSVPKLPFAEIPNGIEELAPDCPSLQGLSQVQSHRTHHSRA